jgi:acylphosphatase
MPGGRDEVRMEARVTGRVHGVGFRYFVLREAQSLGVRGWVANEGDGSVRCVAEGAREDLEQLAERLREGPPAAIVDDVQVSWPAPTGKFLAFGVRSGGHRGD